MPFKTGNWGVDAKLRSKRRLTYFRERLRAETKEQREKRLEKMRQYYMNHCGHPVCPVSKPRLIVRGNPEETKRKHYAKIAIWQQNNSEKRRVEGEAYRRIEILHDTKCELCHARKAEVRHHQNYLEPLKVQFLCKSCHNTLHKTEVKISRL